METTEKLQEQLIFTEENKMSTFMANANNIERRWFVIDAAGQPLGKTAVKAANILRGKHRPEFTPHVDCGEFVIVINSNNHFLAVFNDFFKNTVFRIVIVNICNIN